MLLSQSRGNASPITIVSLVEGSSLGDKLKPTFPQRWVKAPQHRKMFSRRLLLSFRTRNPSCFLPRATAAFRQPLAARIRRFNSQYPFPPPSQRPSPRVIQYDPVKARNAKPLITIDQIVDATQTRSFKWIAIISCGSAIVFYFYNVEVVPVSGRRRFNCYSEKSVEKEGEMMYKKIMYEYKNAILPSWDPRTRMVERVMARMKKANDLEHVNWEVHVIDSPGELLNALKPCGNTF